MANQNGNRNAVTLGQMPCAITTVTPSAGLPEPLSCASELGKKLDPIVSARSQRPLEAAYPFVFVDAKVNKVREEGRVRSRGVLVAIGVNTEGYREVLGMMLRQRIGEEMERVFPYAEKPGVARGRFCRLPG